MSSRLRNKVIGVVISTEYTDTRIPRSTSTSKLSSRERWPRAMVRLHLRCKQHKNRQHECSSPGLHREIGGRTETPNHIHRILCQRSDTTRRVFRAIDRSRRLITMVFLILSIKCLACSGRLSFLSSRNSRLHSFQRLHYRFTRGITQR